MKAAGSRKRRPERIQGEEAGGRGSIGAADPEAGEAPERTREAAAEASQLKAAGSRKRRPGRLRGDRCCGSGRPERIRSGHGKQLRGLRRGIQEAKAGGRGLLVLRIRKPERLRRETREAAKEAGGVKRP